MMPLNNCRPQPWLILTGKKYPKQLPLYHLYSGDCRQIAKTISCHQPIASDSAFSLGMVAEFGETIEAAPWLYRRLFWECGLIGQVLYLEAEAAGIRGTGIGCYFDDSVHEILGFKDDKFQSLYHFTVGKPLEDSTATDFTGLWAFERRSVGLEQTSQVSPECGFFEKNECRFCLCVMSN